MPFFTLFLDQCTLSRDSCYGEENTHRRQKQITGQHAILSRFTEPNTPECDRMRQQKKTVLRQDSMWVEEKIDLQKNQIYKWLLMRPVHRPRNIIISVRTQEYPNQLEEQVRIDRWIIEDVDR